MVVVSVAYRYADIVRHVRNYGDKASPRGLNTREITGFQLVVMDPVQSLPLSTGRQVNGSIAAIEALQLIGGVMDPDALLRAAPDFRNYMDGGTFHGGYGQRTRSQLPEVVRRLQRDHDSRQAVMTMWDPLHDLFSSGVRDYPCTIGLQFLLRHDRLEMIVTMRSNDVWKGLAYDAFVFTQLQQVIAAVLDVEAGKYTHNPGSLHIYEPQWCLVDGLHHPIDPYSGPSTPLVKNRIDINAATNAARNLLASRGDDSDQQLLRTLASTWYASKL